MKTRHAATLLALIITLMPAPTAAQTYGPSGMSTFEQYMENNRRTIDQRRELCRVGTGARTRPCF